MYFAQYHCCEVVKLYFEVIQYISSNVMIMLCSPAPGIVPSSVVLTGFQVLSRVFLTWAVTHSVREVHLFFI